MNETERLAEVAALHHERKRKAEELAAIDRQIDLILFPNPQVEGNKVPGLVRIGKGF